MKKAQNLLEFILIISLIAIAGYAFSTKFDLKKLQNAVFIRPATEQTVNGEKSRRINIEAMTDIK